MKELKDTVNDMVSADYKQRFIAEYQQTKIRYERLRTFCNRIEAARLMGTEEPAHTCPVSLLREQQRCMGLYLNCLEQRALIEEISLEV